MRIQLLILLLLSTILLLPAQVASYRKPYTAEQIKLLTNIKREWDTWKANLSVERWYLMERGIKNGLHPDDIAEGFLSSILHDCPQGDPHETTLEKVQFLLEHNANPNYSYDGPPPSLRLARTIAITKCLLDHDAQLDFVDENNYTYLHYIINRYGYTTEDAKNLIAFFCSIGVKPDALSSDGSSALTLLACRHVDYKNDDHDRTLADTLVKVGTPIDKLFHECIQIKRSSPDFGHIIGVIEKAVEKAQKEVKNKKEEMRSNLIPALLNLTSLPKDPAGIVASYAIDPHEYFVQKILADADAKLNKERQERKKLKETQEKQEAEQPLSCIIL